MQGRLPVQTRKQDRINQPVRLDMKHGYVLYNGEIFNYPSFFNDDVEYLKHLFEDKSIYAILGEANDWDGFWAIVYVTGNSIFAFTDPLGKKQLYYNSKCEISSEIRPLVDDFSDFDPLFKSSVYKWGYNVSDSTPWKKVKRILPNKLYTFYRSELTSISGDYFQWDRMSKSSSDKGLRELLYESVKRRTMSKNYDIGVLVSGGLDSAIIASILNDLDQKVSFYSIENEESKYVDLLSKSLGIPVQYLSYDLEKNLKEIFKWNETPIDLGSVVPQHELFKIIPENIVLSGDGADELFGGYRRINEYDSQHSDIFEELTYYHLPRLDRASMRYTIELRNPFLSHDVIKYALKLPYSERINKKHLKNIFSSDLPKEIIQRKKHPLKNPHLVKDKLEYKKRIFDIFYNQINF